MRDTMIREYAQENCNIIASILKFVNHYRIFIGDRPNWDTMGRAKTITPEAQD